MYTRSEIAAMSSTEYEAAQNTGPCTCPDYRLATTRHFPECDQWRKETTMFYDIYWLDEGNGTEGHIAKSVAAALDWANNEGSGRIRIEDQDGKVVMETNEDGDPLDEYCDQNPQ